MNNGTMRGFTWNKLPAGATYPEMRVQWHQYTGPNMTLGAGDIDCLHLIDTSGGPVSIEINGSGVKDGACIHVAQWGTDNVTITNSDGILRCAGTATTRTEFSVMTALFVSTYFNEWIVFGDITT